MAHRAAKLEFGRTKGFGGFRRCLHALMRYSRYDEEFLCICVLFKWQRRATAERVADSVDKEVWGSREMYYRKAVSCSVQTTLYPELGGENLQVDENECAQKEVLPRGRMLEKH